MDDILEISETLDMSSKQLGEMFEGDFADTCARKFPLMLMWGQVEGPTCKDPHQRERKFLVFSPPI